MTEKNQQEMSACLFCKIVVKQIPASVIHEDDQVVAFNDIDPQAPTHILIIPKKHIESIQNIRAEEQNLLYHMVQTAHQLAQSQKLTRGYRLVINNGPEGGQSVFHLHLHLLGGRKMTWPPG